MRTALKMLAGVYALAIYGFIFLPVVVLILYSFQATLFPIPPFTGPSLRWYEAVLGDRRLMAGLVNSSPWRFCRRPSPSSWASWPPTASPAFASRRRPPCGP
jgi:hypothetical protein